MRPRAVEAPGRRSADIGYREPAERMRRMRLTYVGHSTVLIELEGMRILTDPLLRGRFLHVERRAPPVDRASVKDVDLVLLSHAHHDHLDRPSLRKLVHG